MKDIPGYEGLYAAEEDGRIYSYYKNDYLNPKAPTRSGYYLVKLTKDGISTSRYIHQLVMKTFNPSTNPSLEINHIDFNKANNAVSNLEWVTHRENLQHSARQMAAIKRGNDDVIECVEDGRIWYTLQEAADELGVNKRTVWGHLNGQQQSITKARLHLCYVKKN